MIDKIDLTKIIDDDSVKKRQKKLEKHEKLTVREYLELVEKDPRIPQFAHARADEIICGPNEENVEEIPEEERWCGVDRRYPFFTKELSGVDRPLAMLAGYIKAGKNRASTGKQVVLLVGPPASGKSTTARIVKQGFEDYNVRPVYMIEGCPKQEEPLHVLPRHLREEIGEKLGVRIEGDLCPICREKLKTFTNEDGVIRWWDIPVVQFSFSIQGVRGITSFEPSDEKTSDVTALTGRENISITSVHGYNHPRAFEISGKIPKAERGICEGRELTSSDPQVLQVFFSVAEERELEIQGSSFPHLSVDTVILAHTNLVPFKKFAANKEYEGLHNRFYVIPFPYPLRIKDELAVYKKLIERESDFVRLKKCHIAPGSLELAAMFAVLTRYLKTTKSLLTKAKLYNGEKSLTDLEDANTRPRDIEAMIEEGQASPDLAQREGMFGVSSRDVLAALNTEIVKQMSRKKCLTPLSTIRALRDVFKEGHRMGYSPEDIQRFMTLLAADEKDSVMKEYQSYAVTKVSKAFLHAHEDLSRKLFNQYIEEDRYYRDTKRKFLRSGAAATRKDPVTGKPQEPNIKFMKSIEKQKPLNLTNEQEAEVFRGELLEFPNLTYETYSPLARAVEEKLLQDSKDMLQTVLATDKPLDSEENKRVADLFGAMQNEHGFCEICAAETIEQARALLNK